jgi:hypothetical protein
MKRPPPKSKPVPVPRVPPLSLFVLAVASVAASAWAVLHYHTGRSHPPMLVPAPATTEIPAPSVISVP